MGKRSSRERQWVHMLFCAFFSCVLLWAYMAGMPMRAEAEKAAPPDEIVPEVYYYSPAEYYTHFSYNNTHTQHSDSFISVITWTDKLLLNSSHRQAPDPELAKAAVGLAAGAYQPSYVKATLWDMGFKEIEPYNYSNRKATYADNDFVGFTIAHKYATIDDEEWSIYIVAVRGTPSSAEWYSNFNLGVGDDHAGFYTAAAEVSATLNRDFFENDRLTDPSKRRILLTGHSRGAAVANIIAGQLTKGVNGRKVSADGVFCYTFACPSVSRNADEGLDNIFNFNFSGDLVPQVPLAKQWGFKRNGQTYIIDREFPTAYDNMTRQFLRKNGKEYLGSANAGLDMANALGTMLASQADFNNPLIKWVFDAVAYALGGNTSYDSIPSIGTAIKNASTRPAAYLFSRFDEITSWTDFMSAADSYESEYKQLVEEITEAVADYNDDFAEWKEKHLELVDKLVQYTSIEIENISDVLQCKTILTLDRNDLIRIVDLAGRVYDFFIDSKTNNPITDIKYGHAQSVYVLMINSMYYGYEGWYESSVTAVSIPEDVQTIGWDCFRHSEIEILSLPGGLKNIGQEAFGFCEHLKDFDFPDSSFIINECAFIDCSSLTNVTVPNTVTWLARNAFAFCELSSITLPVERCGDGGAFGISTQTLCLTVQSTGVMPNIKEGGSLRCSDLKEIIIEEGVTRIGDYAFAFRGSGSTLETLSVTLPSTLESIGESAFEGNTLLEIGELPAGLKSLGSMCFARSGITHLNLPAALTEIPYGCFFECKNLQDFVIPENISRIDPEAFRRCDSLTSITIPTTLQDIDYAAFGFCQGLKSVTLPVELDTQDFELFYGCMNVETIHYTVGSTGIMPDRKPGEHLIFALQGSAQRSLKMVIFDEGVKHIGKNAFDIYDYDYDPLKPGQSYIYPDVLLSVRLPSTLVSIGDYAFRGNGRLKINGLPEGLQAIGKGAFEGIAGFDNPVTLPEPLSFTIGEGAFSEIQQPLRVYFNSEGLEYVLAEGVPYTLIDGQDNEYKTLRLPGKLSAVKDEAFAGIAAQKVVVPESCLSIGHRVFDGSKVFVVELPDALEYIEEDAFDGAPVAMVICGENSQTWVWAIDHGYAVCAR